MTGQNNTLFKDNYNIVWSKLQNDLEEFLQEKCITKIKCFVPDQKLA